MNWKKRWRLLPSGMRKASIISILLAAFLVISLWNIQQHYTNSTLRLLSFLFVEGVCGAVVVNGVYFTVKTRKEMGALGYWNRTSTGVFIGFMILFVVLVILFSFPHG